MMLSMLMASGLLAVQSYEMLRIPTAGAEVIVGRLSLPSADVKNILVVDVPGSGPNTFENRRRIGRTTEVRYHDLFATEFARRGIAYLSYNTRYTEVDENRTRIPRLGLPVFLFHGTDDANCPVQGVIDIGNKAREGGRTHLQTFIIPDHGHSLEFVSWAVTGTLSEGLKILFDQVERWPTNVEPAAPRTTGRSPRR